MKILNISQDNTTKSSMSFQKIQLKNAEQELATALLNDLTKSKNKNNIEIIKNRLFEIFDKYFRAELGKYSKVYTHKDDFLQGIYLRFFEKLENVEKKELKPIDFLGEINKIIKPAKDEDKEREHSIDWNISDNPKFARKNFLTDNDLPVYASTRNAEERAEFKKKLENTLKNVELDEKELKTLHSRSNDKTFKEIAEELDKSITSTRIYHSKALLKIQKENNVLPEKVKELADILNVGVEEFVTKGVNYPDIFKVDSEMLKTNVSRLSFLLRIPETEIIKYGLVTPQLFIFSPEKFDENITNLAKFFKVTKEEFIPLVLANPSIAIMKPEKIMEFSQKNSKILEIDFSEFYGIAQRYTGLFYSNPETINQKIEILATHLEISKQEVLEKVIKEPRIISLNTDTLLEKLTKNAKNFNISQVDF